MCTSIVEIVVAEGAGKGNDEWFALTHSVVSYDHPHHALLEEAITIDFVNQTLGPAARAAVELTLEFGQGLERGAAEGHRRGRNRRARAPEKGVALRRLDLATSPERDGGIGRPRRGR